METRTAEQVGKKGRYRYILHSCTGCGKERWVRYTNDKPNNLKCSSCAKLGNRYSLKHGEIIDNGYFYTLQPNHPRTKDGYYVKRAILVLEQMLGRPLREGYDSHHKNNIRNDDRPENLEEKEHGKHMADHAEERRVKVKNAQV
uniref:Putative homing endonuclease n=1 Tax=viral metagenome TaxID=1070528 RepID=A0A6M3LKS6_9ZZZZ